MKVETIKTKALRTLSQAIAIVGDFFSKLFSHPVVQRFFRRHTLAIVAVAVLAGWTLCCVAITKHNTRLEVTQIVTQTVTSELKAEFNQTLRDHNIDPETFEKIEEPLTDDASFLAMVEELATNMDEVVSTYAMDFGIGEEGQMTIAWVWCARHAKNSTEFGKTPKEITEKPGAWEGKVVGHAVQNQYTELCRKVATDYLKGLYPDNFTTALTFFNREGDKIIARNDLYTNAYTIYWWFGK